MKTFIIAEAGINHNGSVEIARMLIDAAKKAGADAVKFQTFDANKLVTKDTPKARYQSENLNNSDTQLEMLKKLQLSKTDTKKLLNYSKKKEIAFISTPFDEESADLLHDLGVEIFKIGSGELTNKPLIEHIARKGKTIVLSTGMSYLGEVEKAVQWIIKNQGSKKNRRNSGGRILNYPLVLLHCVSSYPCPFNEVNLHAMETMRIAFDVPVGFSDHTSGIEISIAAVALGAVVVEKHLTLDRNMVGPDHRASLEPLEFASLVRGIRNVELSLGDGVKKPARCEENTRQIGRRSIAARRKILRDQVITIEDIGIKRPGTGIQPEYIDIVIGMSARKDIDTDSLIKWENLKGDKGQ